MQGKKGRRGGSRGGGMKGGEGGREGRKRKLKGRGVRGRLEKDRDRRWR